MSIDRRITEASVRWSGLEFRRKSAKEASAPCPFCGLADHDGFLIFEDGGYWCRQCDAKGWLDDDKPQRQLTKEELLERRMAEIERKQAELDRRTTALEQMHRCTDHLAYHHYLEQHPDKMLYWLQEGITTESIKRYKLGYCESCPTYRASPSYTIPFINRGKLENIRHRLAFPNGTGKYRPHMANLGNHLFNIDALDDTRERVLLLEGEKKVIVAAQEGLPVVGICGKRAFKREWLAWFAHVEDIVIALDPDATESAYKLAAMFEGKRARVAAFPYKVDDMIVQGATRQDIEAFVKWARPVA